MNRSSSGCGRWRQGAALQPADPGERVQMDVCKIRPGIHQYTALDDCSRYKVLRLYDRASASSRPLDFLNHVVEESPFMIQRIQTDRGREFFAEAVNSASWTGPSNSGPLHHDRRISTAGRTHRADREEFLGHSRSHGLQTSRRKLAEWQHHRTGASAPYGAGRPSPIDRGLRTNRQDAPLGNRRGCIRPHTRAHQDSLIIASTKLSMN